MYYIAINVQYVRYSTGRKIKYFIVIVIVYRVISSYRHQMIVGRQCCVSVTSW
jgi:hypothetical protein